MKEHIIKNLTNFPLEIGNFDKYFFAAKSQLMSYLESRNKKYREWKLLEIECIEPLESANRMIHYNFIFDTAEYCVQLFKNDGEDIAKGNIFEASYEHFNNEFKRVKIGRFFNVGLTGMFWLNLERIKEYLMQEREDLSKLQPQSIIMFSAEKDMFKKDIIFGFRFKDSSNDFSVFSKQPHGYAEPYKIQDGYFNSEQSRNYFGEELEQIA